MSWNSSQSVQPSRSLKAVKPSRKHFKAEQEVSSEYVSQPQTSTDHLKPPYVAKPTGYFNQAMVRLTPQSDEMFSQTHLGQTQSQAVKHSYASSTAPKVLVEPLPKAVKYSYASSSSPPRNPTPTIPLYPQALVRQISQSNYRQAIAYLGTIWVNKSKKDLQTIETILTQLIQFVETRQPSKSALRDTLTGLSQRLTDYVNPTHNLTDTLTDTTTSLTRNSTTNLTSIVTLTQVQLLLTAITDKQLVNPSEADLNEFSARSIRNLQTEKGVLQQKLVQLTQSSQDLKQQILSSSSQLNQLTQKTTEYASATTTLQASIQAKDLALQTRYSELQTQSAQIESLNLQINHLNQQIVDLKTHQNTLSSELLDRDHLVAKRDRTITTLNIQLSKYDRIRVLEGNYIAIPSSKNSKYHFHKKCPIWKMLVGEYMLNLDPSRAVVSSKDANFFIRGGLTECLDCKNKTH